MLGEKQLTIMKHLLVQFDFSYSRNRIENALVSLGVSELDKIIQEDGKTGTHCHFYNELYHFNQSDLEVLKEKALQ